MKLKTLKDFVKRGDDGIENAFRLDLAVELKQEAIKWLEELNKHTNICRATKEWINYFFNITEEDLK